MPQLEPVGFPILFTGHSKLGLKQLQIVRPALRDVLGRFRDRHAEGIVVISGMAVGADIEFAEIALDLQCPLVAALPIANQDSIWPTEAKSRYRKVLEKASQIVEVWKDPEYAAMSFRQQFWQRNLWMINQVLERGVAVAVWDGCSGGGTGHTGHTVPCALLYKNKKVLVLDPFTGFWRVQRTRPPVNHLFHRELGRGP